MENLIPNFYDCTLHQRQQFYYNGHYCFYCKNLCDFVDSKEVYRESYGMIYLCRKCKAHVGVHHGNTDQSYGFVATKELREIRHLCHQKFDPLWQIKVNGGTKKKQAQAAARKWLAEKLGIDVVECHIGMMDIPRCQQVLKICEEVYHDLEVKKVKREHNTKFIVDAIYFMQLDFNDIYKVQEHKMNNLHLLTLTHIVTGFVLKIKPKECLFSLPGKKEIWHKMESVEKLIYKYFKPK